MNFTHLLYVRKYSILTNDYELYVYGVNTKDIFHTMGEIIYRSETQVKRIDFTELTNKNRDSVLNYWKKENKTILTWKDKYNDCLKAKLELSSIYGKMCDSEVKQ